MNALWPVLRTAAGKGKRFAVVLAWVLLCVFFGATAASYAAPVPPLPDSGGVASRWVCTENPPVAADPDANPPVEAELGYQGCAVTEWEALPEVIPPAPGEPIDTAPVVTAITTSSDELRLITIFGLGLLVFLAAAGFFRAAGAH